MKIAKIGITETGLYWGEIRDEYGDVESATLQDTPIETYKWAVEHNCADIILDN
uniref:Uncharacterized protein n=1 Tax=viral metagenome TaxID=1070528 RepID=A0A6H2A520_9ZZZZ